jgi:hypothetical protein
MAILRGLHLLAFIKSAEWSTLCSRLLPAVAFVLLFSRWKKLSHVPGPFLAALSNIPRMSWVWGRRAHEIHIELHRKYGDLVRFGPNMVSIADPVEIPKIYGFTGNYKKVRSTSWIYYKKLIPS